MSCGHTGRNISVIRPGGQVPVAGRVTAWLLVSVGIGGLFAATALLVEKLNVMNADILGVLGRLDLAP